MPSTFKSIQLASTNDHPKDNDKVRKWIEHHGGIYTGSNLTPTTTHLLCSQVAWDRSHPVVVEARKQHIPVVNFEWLTDAFLKKTPRPMRKTEAYDFTQVKFPQPTKKEGKRKGEAKTKS